MALRITLWALLLGTLVLSYFGLQAGSVTTTLVGVLALAFILFLLFFLAKNLLGFAGVILKVLLIIAIIGLLGFGIFKGCSMAMEKGKKLSHSASQSVSETVNEMKQEWYDNGQMNGNRSWWEEFKNMLFSWTTDRAISPSQKLPVPTDEEGNIEIAMQLNGIVREVRTGYLFRIKNHFIKLYGIDTPDPKQSCIDRQGNNYPCGKVVQNKLKQLIFNKQVNCSLVATDGMDNYVATCKMGPYDIGAVMVSSGWAVANRLSTDVYIPYEKEARANKSGLWEGKFIAPWQYRNEQ